MADFNLDTLTIEEAQKRLQNGDFSARDLITRSLEVAREKNDELNAYLEIFEEDALVQADEADKNIQAGNARPLEGIPVALKDNILVKGKRVSAGSKMLENYTAVYDATATQKLRNAGAIILGRTNLDEFAMGSSTENSAFGPAKNPHDISRVPGGSSGGSAVSVAAGSAMGALGSDTGGSIRQPASLCGVVGFKPTYGAVSRHGLIAMGSSLDQIGTFSRSVSGAKILFDCIKGHDPLDSTSIPNNFWGNYKRKDKMTIGIPKELESIQGADEDVVSNFNETLEVLKAKGHSVETISLPHLKYTLAIYYIIMPAEASTNLARFDGVRYGLHVSGKTLLDDYKKTRGQGFGKEVRRRIILGTFVLSHGYLDAYYNKAESTRQLVRRDFEEAYKKVDVIATPTSPTPAFKIGEKTQDPLQMYSADSFTVPANITGEPSISVPSGWVERDGKKLPLGFQITAPHFMEERLFDLGEDISSS